MGLRDLKVAEEIIKVTGGEFSVRGLALNEIMLLVQKRRETLRAAFDNLSATEEGIDLGDQKETIANLLHEAPELIAEVIALASGDYCDETMAIARKLPMPEQMEALEAVGRLTFATEGSLKKVIETVTRVMVSATGAMEDLSGSTNGSGESESKLAS